MTTVFIVSTARQSVGLAVKGGTALLGESDVCIGNLVVNHWVIELDTGGHVI
jgi:hypothetical protein